jgi:hypothetical protein
VCHLWVGASGPHVLQHAVRHQRAQLPLRRPCAVKCSKDGRRGQNASKRTSNVMDYRDIRTVLPLRRPRAVRMDRQRSPTRTKGIDKDFMRHVLEVAAGDQFPLPPSVASFAINHPIRWGILSGGTYGQCYGWGRFCQLAGDPRLGWTS